MQPIQCQKTHNLQVETLSQKLWHFQKNIRSRVENECCCPRKVNIAYDIFTSAVNKHTTN